MDESSLRGRTAVCGLGMSPVGRVFGRSAADLACEAFHAAVADAGLAATDVDGLLVNAGVSRGVDLSLAGSLGLRELRVLTEMNGWGSSAGQMVQNAASAVAHGLASCVACVFADAPLVPGSRSGAVYAGRRPHREGMASLWPWYGLTGPIPLYAMAAQRHMDLYGTTQDQLGAIAVQSRAWAAKSPLATMREPLDLDAYHASPWIAEPFHVLDCCLVSNGAVCVLVTSAERARDLARPPAYLLGMGQAHRLDAGRSDVDTLTGTPAGPAARAAFAMAGASVADVTCCQIYDCYTYTVLVTLEDVGFCAKGEGGPFVEEGRLGPGGALPTNTGGGELSGYYLWGMTPLSEAVIQVRGDGGERQVPRNDLVLVTGNGGVLNHHASLLLSPHPS